MTLATIDIAPTQAGFAPERLARITEHLDRNYIQPGKIAGCQTLVARHGHVAYFTSMGFMDRERRKPMADDTIFRIYSMTKPITSVALMQLYERGYFQLNDPVHRVILEWRDHQVWVSGAGADMQTRAPDRPMTFRHVLSHTGGLTSGGGLDPAGPLHPVDQVYQEVGVRRGQGDTLRGFVEKLARVPLRYNPGERWMYSLATDVCGYLVEALSGQRFDRYLQEHIFGPLGMQDTSFSVAPDKRDRFAANYQRQPDKTLKLVDDPATSTYLNTPTFFSGGGGLTGTTADYHRFCEMLRRGGELDGERILGPRTIKLMTKNHLAGGRDLNQMALGAFSETANEGVGFRPGIAMTLSDVEAGALGGVGFGLGFAMTLSEVQAGALGEGDYYWDGAASTIFWVDPKEDLVVVFMTQLIPSATFNFRGQLKNIIYSAIVD